MSLEGAVRFLPYEIISFRQKKWSSSEIPKFHKVDPSKLGQTRLDTKNISKVKHYFGGFQDSKLHKSFENGKLFHFQKEFLSVF